MSISLAASWPRQAYYRFRRAFAYCMDRVIDSCDGLTIAAYGLRSGRARRGLQAVARAMGGIAYLLKCLPRVDAYELRGPGWRVVYIGDPRFFNDLARLLFPEPPDVHQLPRVPLWSVPRLVGMYRRSADLVVVGLGRTFRQLWRPRGRYVWRSPIWVDQVLDISPPLAELLAGRGRRNARKSVTRAARAGFTARVTCGYEEFEQYHKLLYRPHITRRHGANAELTTLAEQWNEWVRGRGELLVLELDGEVVAAIPLRYVGNTCFNGDEGVSQARGDELYRLGAQAALWRFAIERAKTLGMRDFVAGLSLASCADPVYTSKRRWGASEREICFCGFPEWTFVADRIAGPLREHLNAQGMLTFVEREAMVVQLDRIEPSHAATFKGIRRAVLLGDANDVVELRSSEQ